MPGDLYNPETHRQKKPSVASSAGKGLKKLSWYGLGLFLGLLGVNMFLGVLRAIGDGTFENAKPEQQGELTGMVLGGIIAVFLAFKCLGKGREVL